MSGYSGAVTVTTSTAPGYILFGNASGWGSGALTLSGAGSNVLIGDEAGTNYNGAYTGGSALAFTSGTLAPAGAVTVGAGALLQVNNAATYAIVFEPQGTLTVNGGTLGAVGTGGTSVFVPATGATWVFGGSAASTVSGNVQLGHSGATLQVADAVAGVTVDVLASGVISGGNGFTKTGAGTLNVTGANTYTGTTTVSTGTLAVNNATGSGTGSGAVSIASGASLTGTGTSTGAVSVAGTVAPGNAGTGTLSTGALTLGGTYAAEINGAATDRVTVTGNLDLTGSTLNISATGATQPIYVIASYTGTLTGTFGTVTGLPAGYVVSYNSGAKQIEVKQNSPYVLWASAAGLTSGVNDGKSQDADNDGTNNLGEFAFDGNPLSGVASGKIVAKVVNISGDQVLTLTLPVRSDATAFAAVGPEMQATSGAMTYRIQGSDDLSTFGDTITEVTGPTATAIQAGMPALTDSNWTYHTFRSYGNVSILPKDFLRAKVSE